MSGATPSTVPTPAGSLLAQVVHALDGGRSELDQALLVLAAAHSDADPSRWLLGQADAALLTLHRRLLGREVAVTTACVTCSERNTFVLSEETLPQPAYASAWLGPGSGLRQLRCAELAGLPADDAEAERELLRRCAIGPSPEPRDVSALDRVDTSLSGSVHGGCVGCGATVTAAFDVVHLVVTGLSTLRATFDVEVHRLAARYGWTLGVIESLPDARRHRLAELAGASA